MNRRNLFETRRQLFLKTGFVVISCFSYTKLDCRDDWIKAYSKLILKFLEPVVFYSREFFTFALIWSRERSQMNFLK